MALDYIISYSISSISAYLAPGYFLSVFKDFHFWLTVAGVTFEVLLSLTVAFLTFEDYNIHIDDLSNFLPSQFPELLSSRDLVFYIILAAYSMVILTLISP